MVDEAAIEYAKSQMQTADLMLSEIEDRVNEDSKFDLRLLGQDSNIIQDCQQAIEVYTKAMFKLVGVNPPESHEIDFGNNRTEGFLNSDFPDEFESESDLPRVVFLTHFWKQFYTEAKYGYPERNLRPFDLFDRDDANRALEHARFVQDVGQELLEEVE